jgi:hypothetical protein
MNDCLIMHTSFPQAAAMTADIIVAVIPAVTVAAVSSSAARSCIKRSRHDSTETDDDGGTKDQLPNTDIGSNDDTTAGTMQYYYSVTIDYY